PAAQAIRTPTSISTLMRAPLPRGPAPPTTATAPHRSSPCAGLPVDRIVDRAVPVAPGTAADLAAGSVGPAERIDPLPDSDGIRRAERLQIVRGQQIVESVVLLVETHRGELRTGHLSRVLSAARPHGHHRRGGQGRQRDPRARLTGAHQLSPAYRTMPPRIGSA